MRLTIVGSGTLLPDDDHRSAGHLLEWSEGKLLLDCGSGVVHGLARDGRDWRRITHVALSHFHTDHIGDLAALFWAWKHGVPAREAVPRTLLGPPGVHGVLDGLERAHGDYVRSPGGPLRIVELARDAEWADGDTGLVLRTRPARHTPEAVVIRVEVDGRAVGYTGDTGPDPGLATLFRDADVLVSECGVADESGVDIHLSPSEVADLARDAHPRHLVVTHRYPTVPAEAVVEAVRAAGYGGPIHVAADGFTLEI